MSLITLVRPAMTVLRLVQSRSTCPPIGVAYLASSLQRAGHTVEVIDAVGEAIFQMYKFGDNYLHGLTVEETVDRVNPRSDFIGVSCMFSIEWPAVREVLKALRRRFPEKSIIIGGEHVTAAGDWILNTHPEVDYCVLGEGDDVLVKLVGALSKGSSVSNIPGVLSRERSKKPERSGAVDKYLMDLRIRDVDDIPLPAWELMPLSAYLDNGFGFGVDRGRNMPMLATRGCPYQCTFCSSPQMWSTKWLARNPKLVLDEMEMYMDKYRAENFSFYDLTAIVKREWIITFCKLILERGLSFTWQLPSGTRSEAIDAEVSELLYKTGCRNLNYAPESGSKRTLERIKKRVNLDAMKISMRAAIKNGLVVKCNTIMGFPGETHVDLWRTLRWAVQIAVLGVHDVTFTCYVPYPGTEIYDGLRASGRLPGFSDEYFATLSTKGNFFKNVSWSAHISNRALTWYIILGNLHMLGLSVTLRPLRFYRAVRNVLLNQKEESRLEATLRIIFRQFKRLYSSGEVKPYLGTRGGKG